MNVQEIDNSMHGVHHGLYVGQFDRVDELNMRMSDRHFPTRELQPNFGLRPVPTKYSLFPVIEQRAPREVPIVDYPKHNLADNFNPATRPGPPTTYLANIDTESILRNQCVSLQRGAEQGVYVPSSESSLYHTVAVGRQETQSHPGLFERSAHVTAQCIVDKYGVGANQLYNHTRTQLRSIDDESNRASTSMNK